MTERSYQDAVQLLRDQLGNRWEGAEADGRDEMVAILKKQLGYDSRAANDTIDAMIESGTLRYHRAVTGTDERAVGREDEAVPPVVPVVAGVPSGGTGMGGVPLAAGVLTAGYWQIGPAESDTPGRAGQVIPS
jgi:hypothetical protein